MHLALLQFCYFFLLLVNVTSTYVTYMSIVVSWMLGTLLGLWIGWLRPLPMFVAGGVAYYLVYALVIAQPLWPLTLPIACVGVVITGLWAGRFFVEMRPYFRGVDRLFFHENNGFLFGVIAVFVGFSLGGLPFLLGAPLVSAIVLFVYLRWLLSRRDALAQAIAGVDSSAAADHAASGRLAGSLAGAFNGLVAAAGLGAFGLPLVYLLAFATSGRTMMVSVLAEGSGVVWLAVACWLAAALVAAFELTSTTRARSTWPLWLFALWAVLAAIHRALGWQPFALLSISETSSALLWVFASLAVLASLVLGTAARRPRMYLGLGLLLVALALVLSSGVAVPDDEERDSLEALARLAEMFGAWLTLAGGVSRLTDTARSAPEVTSEPEPEPASDSEPAPEPDLPDAVTPANA
ncbi:MAG: hypothetical protein KDG50_07705 [Chromatiales bacterium]|nr:hypothetical protein [Chromatiales bacterium]